jgi:hypothetical protein
MPPLTLRGVRGGAIQNEAEKFEFPRPLAAGDRNYWLARCEGFEVYAGRTRLGVVESLRFERHTDRPDSVVVRSGLLRLRRTVVAVDDVVEILPRRKRLLLAS